MQLPMPPFLRTMKTEALYCRQANVYISSTYRNCCGATTAGAPTVVTGETAVPHHADAI